MKNIKGEEIDVLTILKNSPNYSEFYFSCLDEGIADDDMIEEFYFENEVYCGVNV
jgi:hypothetical protein